MNRAEKIYEERSKAIEGMYEELDELNSCVMRLRAEISKGVERLDDLKIGKLIIIDEIPAISDLVALNNGQYCEFADKYYAVNKTDEATTITITSTSIFPDEKANVEIPPLREFTESDYALTRQVFKEMKDDKVSPGEWGREWSRRTTEMFNREGIAIPVQSITSPRE